MGEVIKNKRSSNETVIKGVYRYRSFIIPKKNGKVRNIIAPSKPLLQYQRKLLPKLGRIYKHHENALGLYDISHGFIKGRNPVTAAEKHIGYKATLMMDISDFFDSVTRDMMKKFDAHIASDDLLFHKLGYCGQGFATSPIISAICILPLLKVMNDSLRKRFNDDFTLTIYADDIQVSCNSDSPYEELNAVALEFQTEAKKFGFTMHPHKTRIRLAKYGHRRILGINVTDTDIRGSRKTMRKIRAAKHQGRSSSLGGLTTWSRCIKPKSRV